MADDKTEAGELDRSFVVKGEGYEFDYFAQKHGLSRDQARAHRQVLATFARRSTRQRNA